MKTKINFFISVGILLLVSLACNFNYSTANLSDIKFDKDKSGENPTTVFNPEDEIFAITSVDNASGENKVKFRLLFKDVEGAESGEVAYKIQKEVKTEGSQKVWLNFGVPGGFVPGSYKVEAVLTGEDGKKIDRKMAIFTIKDGNSTKTKRTKKDSSKEIEKQEDEDSDET